MRSSHNYDAWNIKAAAFPKNSDTEDQIKFLIGYGILAPSTHNTQPWKLEIQSNTLKISPNLSLRLPQTDPVDRDLFISLGCLVRNIEVAAAYFGFLTKIDVKTSRKLTREIKIVFKKGKGNDRELAYLFKAIVKRFSNKMRYEDRPVAMEILNKLGRIKIKSVHGIFIDDRSLIAKIAVVHKESVAALSGNSAFAKEIASWLRPNNTKDFDGMPGFVMGLSGIQSIVAGRVLFFNPAIFSKTAQMDVNLIMSSPVLGIVASLSDEVNSWIDVGRVYETVALNVVSLGLSMTPMQAMIENKASREKLSEMMGLARGLPQMFFRLGYSQVETYHTPRRPLGSVIGN